MAKTKILVVEDEGIIARDLQNVLTGLGYVVSAVVSSGEAAVEQAAQTRPDLVLMDIVLDGEIDGIEAAEQIRIRFDIPVIFLTAYADEKMLKRAKVTEPFGYLLKPFEDRELSTNIEMALYKHQMEKKLRESEKQLEVFFSQSLDGCFFMMLDEPVQWDDTVDKERVLDYVFAHQRITKINEAMLAQYRASREQLLSLTPNDFFAHNLSQGRAIWRMFFDQGRLHIETNEQKLDGTPMWIEGEYVCLYDEQGRITGHFGIQREITERKQAEKALHQQNRNLALLNQVGQTLAATLDFTQVIEQFLRAVSQMTNAEGSSVWLWDTVRPTKMPDQEGELVCQAILFNDQYNFAPDLRLPSGQGIADWVAQSGQSTIVTNVQDDPLFFPGIDRQTGVCTVSLLAVPLWVRGKVVGVLEVINKLDGNFNKDDRALVETLAASAAIAIDNARLLEQAHLDAETKATLLNEVNHRVKNNLASIMGILALEMDRPYREVTDFRATLQDLQNRIQGLATVHDLLSASQWSPLPLEKLVTEVIWAALSSSPIRHKIEVTATRSGRIEPVREQLAEPLLITPKQATGLALVINELTTNSIKHAFLEQDQGRIEVDITVEDEDDRQVRLQFRDDGPGWPDEVLRDEDESIGLRLVRMTVRSPLRGQLALYNEAGAVAIVTFKLAPPD